MGINEFKNRINLITGFVIRINELNIPDDIKRTLVKIYANMLKINLTDSMVDNITHNPITYA